MLIFLWSSVCLYSHGEYLFCNAVTLRLYSDRAACVHGVALFLFSHGAAVYLHPCGAACVYILMGQRVLYLYSHRAAFCLHSYKVVVCFYSYEAYSGETSSVLTKQHCVYILIE